MRWPDACKVSADGMAAMTKGNYRYEIDANGYCTAMNEKTRAVRKAYPYEYRGLDQWMPRKVRT